MTRPPRTVLRLGVAVVGVLGASLLADLLIPPADADLPLTLYVDARTGNDGNDGRLPDRALGTLDGALARAVPGTDILLTGYGTRLTYRGTGTTCRTIAGTRDEPVTIRRNVYTNTLYPTVLSANASVPGPWTLEAEHTGGARTWSTPWPERVQLSGDPDLGFVKIGGIALTGYARRPPESAPEAAWWAAGRLYARTARADPAEHDVVVKNGDAICLSAASRHVRVKDLMVDGAVHAVRAEPGAVDIEVEHLVRANVLDDDLPASLDPDVGR